MRDGHPIISLPYCVCGSVGIIGPLIVLYFVIAIKLNSNYCDDAVYCYYESVTACTPHTVDILWEVNNISEKCFNVTLKQTIDSKDCANPCCDFKYERNFPYRCKLDDACEIITLDCERTERSIKMEYEKEMNGYLVYWLIAFALTCVCVSVCLGFLINLKENEKIENEIQLSSLINKDDT